MNKEAIIDIENPKDADLIGRQAAIDFINNHLPFRATSEVYDAYADCVRMLGDNKALPPVNRMPCEDAISRQAVLDYIHRIFNQGTGKKKSFEFIQKYVEKLPPVTPQPKTGHWIPIQETIGVDKEGNEMSATVGYKCSKCKEKHESKTLYCPSCGAMMDEPQGRSDKE